MKAASRRKRPASMTIGAIFERIKLNDELMKAFCRLLDHRGRRTDHRKAYAFVIEHVLSLIEAELSIGRRTPTFRKQWVHAINEHADWNTVRRRVSQWCIDEVAGAFARHASSRPNFDEMPDDPRSFDGWIKDQIDKGYVRMGPRTYSLVYPKIKSCVFVIDAVHCVSTGHNSPLSGS